MGLFNSIKKDMKDFKKNVKKVKKSSIRRRQALDNIFDWQGSADPKDNFKNLRGKK